MLTIICGEDLSSSRNYLTQLKQKHLKKGDKISNIAAKDIEDILKSESNTVDLFGQKSVFFVDNLNTAVGRSKNDTILKALKEIETNDSIILYDWEEGKSERELKIKTIGTLKEFKPDSSIFQLLDSCYPTNRSLFLTLLDKVIETQDEGFVYAMLCKHIRTLILAYENALPSYVQAWQRKKLSTQASHWNIERLVGMYEGLARIDVSLKTSTNIFGIKRSLEMLAVYFL